jgi:6-phosphogluconolactonase (cycloisomerase 2 family)
VIFRIDSKTGALSATGQILNIPSPVSLKFSRLD